MGRLVDKLLWKYYYRYKPLSDSDSEGAYSAAEKAMMFLNITKVNLWGDYLTPERLKCRVELLPERISDIIFKTLSADGPCMVARFGANEQRIVANYLSIVNPHKSIVKAVTGRIPFWWWNKQVRKDFTELAGFFPDKTAYLEQYAQRMIEDTKSLDVLLAWFGWEPLLIEDRNDIQLVGLQEAEPWWQKNPWTRYLKGKKVLVVHPFAELIESQYNKRARLFANQDVLPEFELKTLKAVQSIGGRAEGFDNWFEALEWMEGEMDRTDYDVALIGCGAYGFCLAAHAKRSGRKAVHLGGVLQLLFGIKGNRWEDKNYHPVFDYTTLFNDAWVKPDQHLRPENAEKCEGACYW